VLSDDLRERYPRVAISHEWLTVPGGSEKVVLALLDLLPHAELFTAVYDPAPWPAAITDRPVHTSFLNRIDAARRSHQRFLPLMNQAFRRFDLAGFDLVVSSNHACAKNVRAPAGTPHVCYCHTPMRYAWDPSLLEVEDLGRAERAVAPALTAWLRRTDRRAAAGVDRYAANSSFVAGRIRRHYGREADVVFPPVDVDRFLERPRAVAPDAPYLFFGRVVPYKRADLAVRACVALGRPLVVAGGGRGLESVRRLAEGHAHIQVLGRISDAEMEDLFTRARGLLFPGVEDFGIVPVEAQAAGLPVIAFGEGGVCDSVLDGVTGVLYDDPSAAGLAAGIERFEGLALDERALRTHAATFGPDRFAADMGAVLLAAGAAQRAGVVAGVPR